MSTLLEKLWNWVRAVEYGVLARWGAAIFVILVWVHPYAKAVAEETVLQILKGKGFTVDDFKEVQTDVGAMKQTINNINNTLTIDKAQAETARQQIDTLYEYIINKKTNREDYPQ